MSDYKVYQVGGSVRDRLLGLASSDIDFVVVGATHEQLLAEGFKEVGADFPVFLHPTTGDEYAMARVERKTGPGYLGFDVKTENVTLEEDLSRRDLTINAMALDEDFNVVDPYGGQLDLQLKILRHVSAAFSEDPLRVVRLARFAARFSSFKIAPETEELCRQMVSAGQLNELPTERFRAEIFKLFEQAKNPARFFEVLKSFDAFTHVKYFRELFGSDAGEKSIDFSVASKNGDLSVENRITLFLAAHARESGLHLLSNEDQAAWRLLRDIRNMNFSVFDTFAAEKLEAFFTRYRLGQNQTLIDKFELILDPRTDRTNSYFTYELRKWLVEGLRAYNTVSSDQFIAEGLSGKALGIAIKDSRTKLIRSVMI